MAIEMLIPSVIVFDDIILYCIVIISRLELMYYFTYLSHPTVVCFFPVGLSLLIRHFQQVLWVLKFLQLPKSGDTHNTHKIC
jgi:hypothetical protein